MIRMLAVLSLGSAVALFYWLDANAVLVGTFAIPLRALLSAAVGIFALFGVRPWL